ncbi:MAG: sigma 54-interacting transcriptional regulator [Bacillota bacterium]|nr:sigma 54-interacting transcriptional regulator [Bacillota bacterium]
MVHLNITIHKKNGLHVRIAAALIVRLQELIKDPSILNSIFVEFNGRKVQLTNLLSLVSLRIRQGDIFTIIFKDEPPLYILNEIKGFLEKTETEDSKQSETDRLLMENSVIFQEAVANLPSGMVVVNRENSIIYVNNAASKLLDIDMNILLNKKADEVIPQSKLKEVMETGRIQVARKLKLKKYTVLANRAPIFYHETIIGAVAIIQDISDIEKLHFELEKEKELQERLNLVLESVSDFIALTDEAGNITYMNEQMEDFLSTHQFGTSIIKMIGESEWLQLKENKISPIKVIKLFKSATFIMKCKSIILDNRFKGIVISLSPYNEIKELLKKLKVMEQRTKYLENELSKHLPLDKAFETIIGNSDTLIESLTMANKVSKTNSTVLITGDSGTGKELVAWAIHFSSDRKSHSFIRVNCAAIPPNLIESELFGHEKGAFTGAVKTHQGKFELAHNGTIFLDEIGDLSIELQAKLLRVLQEKEIERVGGFKTIKLNVRVIAATHRDLKRMVEEGTFREDLFYRLHVIPIHLPSLQNRKEDIPLLVEHFRNQFNLQLGKNINGYDSGFLEILGEYHWPGNIRELQNIMERVMTLAEGNKLSPRDLPQYIFQDRNPILKFDGTKKIQMFEEYEKQIYENAAPYYPSYNQLAQALGLTHKTVAAKLKKYQIEHLLGKKYQLVEKFS